MGFSYKYIIIFFVLLQSSSIVNGLNVDCDGKAFHCVNVTHFKICVTLGGGISKTVDDFLLPCPDNTFCMPTNRYECEYHETTTTTIKSDFSEISELRKVTVIPLLAAENESETTTAAVKEITEKSSTLSILKNIEDTSSKPASKKDEKFTSETFFDFNPTESYLASAEQNFDANDVNKEIENHYENTTKDFKIINKTEYSSPKRGGSNKISDKNVTLDNITTDNSVNKIENNKYLITIDQEKIMPSHNKTIVKKFANIPYDKLNHTLNNNNFGDKSKTDNETSGKNLNYANLNLSNSTGSEKDEERRVKEPSSLNPTLSIRNISFVEKSKNHENTTEDFHKNDKAEYFINKNEDASQMGKATSDQNVNIASLSVSNSTGNEIDEDKRVYETNSVEPTSMFVEKSIKDDKVGEKDILTEMNTSSVVHDVLNKTSDKNKEGEKNVLIPNPLLTTNSRLAVHDDYIDAKLNINGSETLDSRSVPFYEEIKGKKDITNVIVTMSPTNNENNYLQVVTDVSTNGEQLLDNFTSTSAYPDVIVNMKNYTFYEKNETTVTSNTVIHKQSKEFVSKLSYPGEEGSISVNNITSYFDDHYLNSSLSLNSESPVDTIIPTDVSKLSDKLEIEIRNVSNFTNSNNFSVSLNDNNSEITDNVIFTTEESSNRNENKTNSEDDKIYYGDTPININVLNGTIQEPEVNSPKTKFESVNENDPKLLREAHTLSILELQTTTEDSEVVKTTTININELNFRDDQHKTVIETETVKYAAKNETIHDSADITANQINIIIKSSIIPNSTNNFMSLSKFENNLTTVPENKVIKRGFDNEKNNDDKLSTRTSSSSFSNLLHEIQTTTIYETMTTSAASILNINNDEPNKKNTTSFLFTTEPATENYDTYPPDSPEVHTTTKRPVEPKTKENDLYDYDSITAVTSSIVHNSSLLTVTERYDSSKIALEDLSFTDLRLVMNRNINGSRWLGLNENIPSAAVKNDTINFNNAVVYTHNIKNISKETHTTYNTSDDSSLFVATTDSYVISTSTSNSYTTKSEVKIGQPNVKNTYFTEEKFVASTLKKSESQISPPSAYNNLQERIDTQTIHSVLKTTSIEPYETTTQIEQIYFSEIETDSHMVSSSIQSDKLSNNTALPNKTFEDFKPTSSNDKKIMMNATEMDKDFPSNHYPINLLLLSKSNNSDSSLLLHDDNLDPTTEIMKSVFLTHKAIPDSISDTNDLTNNILINATEKYKSILFTDLNTYHIDINNTEVSTTTTSVTNPGNQSVPVQLKITTTSSKESKLKQLLNRIESPQSTMPVTLIKAERIKLTVDENYILHATKRNTTVNSYNNSLEKDLPLNISKKNNTTDILLLTQDFISSSNNDSALLKDFISIPKIPLIRNTPLVLQSKGDIISKPTNNTNMPVNINNLTTSSSILNKLVNDFYVRNSETNAEAKLKIINSQNNNYMKSNTSLDLQITNGILRPLLEITLGDKTENSSNTLDILKSRDVYKYSTSANNSEVDLNNNYRNTALIDTISGKKENLHTKLTDNGLKDQLNITQSIKNYTGNTRTEYLLAQAPPPAISLTNNSQNSKENIVTKSNSPNLSDTIVIRQNDALNLKVLPTQYTPVLIHNVTKNKPITYPELVMNRNINGSRWLGLNENIPSAAVKNDTINFNNAVVYTHNIQNISKETHTTYNTSDDSSLFVATTDSYVISTSTSNSYTTKSEVKIGQPNVKNTYFTEEKFVASTLKKSESQISPPSAYNNLQERIDTQTIHSVLKTTSIEPYETTTQIEQIYFREIETDSNMVSSSIQYDKLSNNTALPNKTFEDFKPTSSNGTSSKRGQVEFDQLKIMMNATEMDKDFPLNHYPINLLLLSKSNNSDSSLLLHDDNLDPTTEIMKSVFLTHKASPDSISDTNDLTNNILTNATEKYKSILFTDLNTYHIDINSTEVSTTTTSVTNPGNLSVPVQLKITTTSSKESKLKQILNRTESPQSTMPVTLIKAERIKLTVDENYILHATKRNTTVNSYNNSLEKDLPLNISKKNNTTDILLLTQDFISSSNNDSALLKDFISIPKIPLIRNTPLVLQSKGDIISKPTNNTNMPVNINNLTTSSSILNKLVNDFYVRNSETNAEAKLKIINSQNNNYMRSNTSLDLQITNGILRPLLEITLGDKTENSSNTLDSTSANNSEVDLNNNNRNTALIDTISGKKENLHTKLTGNGLKDQLNITQSIKNYTGNTRKEYLLAQAPPPAISLTNNSQNSKENIVTKSNSPNLSDTIVIRQNDALNLKVLPTQYTPVLIHNVTKNKPITYPELVMNRNISGSRWLGLNENIPSAAVKNDTINFNNSVVYTHNIQNISKETHTTYNTSDDSSLFVATTDSYVISTSTSNSYTTKSEVKIGQPNVKNTYFTEEKFVASTLKKSESQISPPSAYNNLQERIDTPNRTESPQSTMPVTLIKAERIKLTVDENYILHATKRNTTVNSYNNSLEKDLPLNISKKNNTTDILLFTQDFISSANNDSALLKDFISIPKIPLIRNTPLVLQSKGDIISKPTNNTNMPVNINNLTTSSSILNKLVNDFYVRNSETNAEAKLKIINSQNNNYMKSNTSLDLQITNGILRPLLEITLGDKTENSSNTLDILKSRDVYKYSTSANNSEVGLNNNNSNTALIDTISGKKENLHTKLTGNGLKDQLNITQSIKNYTGNTRTEYLLAQAPPPAISLTNNSQNSKENIVTKSNSPNLSDTIVIRQNDALNLKVLPTQYTPVLIHNVTKNKPITYPEHKNISQGNEIKTNAPILQFKSNFNKIKTKFIGLNVNNTLINNLRKPTSLLSNMSSLNKSIVNASILDNEKATTINNDTGLNGIPMKNLPITYLLGDKSSYFNQTKSYNQTHTVTTELPENNAKADGMKANKCLNQPNGKYADKDDCKKFYLCLGDAMPVFGECPNGTVFSESKKQCTKNLSQCYRNNRFICLSPGRYYDLSVKNIYYICEKNSGGFIQFKYKCQNGYSLNKTIVKCTKDSDTPAQNNSDSNTKEDSASISVESSSKAAETLRIKSSKKGNTEFECKKEGKYPHPKKCNQYFLCTKVKKSVFHRKVKSCDSGEVFDKEKKLCVDSDSHEC